MMSQRLLLVLCLLLSALMVSCRQSSGAGVSAESPASPSSSSSSSSASTLCTSKLEYEGTITAIRGASHGNGLTLLMHGRLGQVLQQDQFLTYIEQQQTRIYDHRHVQCRRVSLSVLHNGQQLRIQSTGIVVTTYPGQIDAVEVIILS